MVDNTEDITLDDVLNTGENSDRNEAPKVDADGNPIVDTPPNPNPDDDNPAPKVDADGNPIEEEETRTDEEIAAENNDKLKNLFNTFVDETNLSDSDKANRTGLLTKYKGAGFNEDGDIIDENGQIVQSFEDIVKYLNEPTQTTVNENGDEVDAEGKVLRTKVQIAVDSTVVNKLHDESAYKFLDDDGNVKIYEDSEEGFKEFSKDISYERFNEFKEEFFGQNPVLTEVAKHLLSGNDLDTFNMGTDYSKLDASTMSKEEKISYIKRSFEVSGLDKDRVNSVVQLIIDSNSVDDEINKAIPALQKHEADTVASRDAAYQQSIEDRNDAIEKHWEDVNTVVTKGQLNEITIPDADKKDFYAYVSDAIDDKGNSKELIDRQNETLEQQLMLSYLRFKGFNLDKLVALKARETKIKGLKEMIKQSAKIESTPVNDNQRVTSGESDITIGSLLG